MSRQFSDKGKIALGVTAAVAAFVLGIGGCEQSAEPAASSPSKTANVLKRGNGSDPQTLDPAVAEDVHAFHILIDLYEGLVAEAADGSLVAGVAESWAVSDDGTTYTFQLRKDARWSDNTPVLADDFVRGFRRAANSDTASTYSLLLDPIQNFAAIKAGTVPVDKLGVARTGSHTLVIRLERPTSHFLSLLAMPVSYPLHASQAQDGDFSDPQRFVGNGAYRLVDWQPNYVIRLRRNDHYWNRQSVEIEEVQFFPMNDRVAELNAYRTDGLHITYSIPPSHVKFLRETLSSELKIAPRLALYYLAFDTREPPFDQLDVRQALSMAVDRDSLVALLGRGEQPACSIVPPGVENHTPSSYAWCEQGLAARIEAAKQLLAGTGYSSEKPLSAKLLYDNGDVHEKIAVAVSEMWRRSLGLDVTLEKMEWKYFLATRAERSAWDIMRFSWIGDYNGATTFLNIFRSSDPQNLSGIAISDYDELLESADAAVDAAERRGILHRAETRLLAEYPIAPLYFFVSKHLVKPEVRGFEMNVMDRHPSSTLRLSKTED